MTDRIILALRGADRVAFLQDLVTNDIAQPDRLVWTALLTPQGKYLVDFFVLHTPECLLLDVAADHADALVQRLSMYRLRRDVQIETTDLKVARGLGTPPEGARPDPRADVLGWRKIGSEGGDDGTDFEALRVAHCIPETGVELIPNETYPLEVGFERLRGVDFRKGCYVGQEVVARMKHKIDLKKGLVRVAIQGSAPVGSEITAGDKIAGALFTQSGGFALAYLRHDRAKAGPLRAGEATLELL